MNERGTPRWSIGALGLVVSLACSEPPGPGDPVWTVRLNEGGEDRGLDIEAAVDGTIVIVGTEDPGDHQRAFVRALDPDGNEVWVRRHEGEHAALASGVAVDGAGYVMVVGAVMRADEDWDIWVQRYAPDGTAVWSDVEAGPGGGEDQAVGVAVLEGELATVAGYLMQEDGTTDAWVRTYRSDGTMVWTDTYDGPGGDFDVATDVAAAGAAPIVVGWETSTRGDTDIWLRAYDGGGAVTWTTIRDGPARGDDRGAAVAIGPDGTIFAAGTMVVPGRAVDAWMGAYDPDGRADWSAAYDGPASLGDGFTDIAVDDDGTLAVGGYLFTQGERWDVWIRALRPSRDPLWTHEHGEGAGGDDVAAGIAFAPAPARDVLAVGSVQTGPDRRAVWVRRLAR